METIFFFILVHLINVLFGRRSMNEWNCLLCFVYSNPFSVQTKLKKKNYKSHFMRLPSMYYPNIVCIFGLFEMFNRPSIKIKCKWRCYFLYKKKFSKISDLLPCIVGIYPTMSVICLVTLRACTVKSNRGELCLCYPISHDNPK